MDDTAPTPCEQSDLSATTSVDVVSASVSTSTFETGVMTTYRLKVSLGGDAANVYAFAGTPLGDLTMPAAYQTPVFGVDVGGVSPQIYAQIADAEFDSWLTIGMTDGSDLNAISASPGLGLSEWSESGSFSTDNGAIFWMNPADGPTGCDITMAQLTVPTAESGAASGVVQGRSDANGAVPDWQTTVSWSWEADGATPFSSMYRSDP